MSIHRKKTRPIKVKDLIIGGNAPISVQSMTKKLASDIKGTIREIQDLEKAGCDIARIAVPDFDTANAIKKIKKRIDIPLVADIHFNHKLAIESIKNGADKIRINPGNIGSKEKIGEIVKCAKDYDVPIRIGVNSGSLEKDILEKHKKPCADALVESAKRACETFEDMDFGSIIVSLKSADVLSTIEAYTKFSSLFDYPLHIGITEAGISPFGFIRSSIGIGTLLCNGIGDTIRVSLTASPVQEVIAGIEILKSLGIRKGPIIISCPTCGRCQIDVQRITEEVNSKLNNSQLKTHNSKLKIAIMGCIVNGPGEAKEADIGISGGKGIGILFKKGKVIKKVKEEEIVNTLMEELKCIEKS